MSDDEVFAEAKQVAVQVVEALLTYPARSTPPAVVGAALALLGGEDDDPDIAGIVTAVDPIIDPRRRSWATVVNPQLGGLDPAPEGGQQPTRSSVLVVVDHFLGGADDDADAVRVRRCIDVRLRSNGDVWRWEGLGDIGGTPIDRPADLPRVAKMVLDHPDIDLPDSARWDIHSGIIDEDLLKVMVLMAATAPYRVTCLKSGHPETVFAQAYLSNHTVGRAVDVWSVDGQPVIAQSARTLGAERSGRTPAHAMTEMVLERTTVGELGSPWDLDGPATSERPRTRSFTNTVHADHLHVAFDAS